MVLLYGLLRINTYVNLRIHQPVNGVSRCLKYLKNTFSKYIPSLPHQREQSVLATLSPVIILVILRPIRQKIIVLLPTRHLGNVTSFKHFCSNVKPKLLKIQTVIKQIFTYKYSFQPIHELQSTTSLLDSITFSNSINSSTKHIRMLLLFIAKIER